VIDPRRREEYLTRQVAHWRQAAASLAQVEELTSPSAWQSLEQYLGVTIRRCLLEAVTRLLREGDSLAAALSAAREPHDWQDIRKRLLAFRLRYLRTETTLDFYADAINTRSSPRLGALLRACDALAYRSMAAVLDQLGLVTPLVLCYVNEGLGASILKANLRLWDRETLSPAAAIKVVRHNLDHPTAIIHETGHQVAHMTGWTSELASRIRAVFSQASPALGEGWSSWASEINADVYAFVHTGFASVKGLHDVVAGDHATAFRYISGDPHPISYLRVLLGVEFCRHCYGPGPWDDLRECWVDAHPLEWAGNAVRQFIIESEPYLPALAEVCLRSRIAGFGQKRITDLVDPNRVRPEALLAMEAQLGPALYTSMHWIWTESIRLLALTGYKAAVATGPAPQGSTSQDNWMFRLGASLRAA
jgi:hypothetical protein